MKTFAHVLLVVLWLPLLPVSAPSQTDKSGTVATGTAKSATEKTTTAVAPPEQKLPSDQEQPQLPAPVELTSSQPFVPGWLLGLFSAIFVLQCILLWMYSGVGRQLKATQAAADGAQSAIDDLKESVDGVGAKLGSLKDEVNAIRRSQEPILAIAVNRMASASQFPFAPQVTAVTPDHGMPEGGTQVSIAGRNFSPDAQIWFGGINQPARASSTATRLEVTVPAGSAGEVEIYVVNPNGMMSQQQRPLTYRYIPFHLAEIANPSSPDVALHLTGEGFSAATRVMIDGRNADRVTVQNERNIELPIPAGGQKNDTRRVILTNDGGDRSEERTFVQP